MASCETVDWAVCATSDKILRAPAKLLGSIQLLVGAFSIRFFESFVVQTPRGDCQD